MAVGGSNLGLMSIFKPSTKLNFASLNFTVTVLLDKIDFQDSTVRFFLVTTTALWPLLFMVILAWKL